MDPAAIAPPEGFTLDAPQSSGPPPPPEGFQLDQASPPPPDGFTLDTPQPQSSALGAGARSFARTLIPNTIGAIAGVATAAGLAPEVSPFVSVPAGFAAAGATTYAAQRVQDELTDKLGITSEDQRQADAAQHPTATTVGELATAIPTFGFGAEAALAKRALSGGIVGSANLVQQGITKGPENIDPTEALTAAGVGAALPNVRPWAEAAVAPLQRGVTKAVQSGLTRGWGGGSPPGGADVVPAAEAQNPALREEERANASTSPPTTSPAAGVAPVHQPVEGAQDYEQPSTDLTNAGDGFQSKTGKIGRDLGKGSPQKGEGVSGAPSTPLEMTDPAKGGMSDSMADTIRQQQGEAPNDQINEKAPPQPPPPAPPPEQNPQAAQPAPQAPGQEDLTIPTGLRRNPNPDVYKLPAPGSPDLDQVQTRGQNLADEAAQQPTIVPSNPENRGIRGVGGPADMENPNSLYRSSPETQARTDELARTSAANADADQQSFKDRIAKIVAARKAGQENPEGYGPEYSDAELDDQIAKRQSLGAAAPGEEDMGYGPNAPRAAVKAVNSGLWQRANAAFDRVFKLPQSLFAPNTVSDASKQADQIISKHMGEGTADLAQRQNALQAIDTYFHNMSPADRTSAVTEYENGPIPADHPGNAWMKQARVTSDTLDSELTASGGTDTYARSSLPSFFEDSQGPKLREDMDLFKQENKRYPTLGEAMKWGFKLKDDLVNADGSPDPQKVVNQQNFAKANVVQAQRIIKDMTEGWTAKPGTGVRAADPLLHPAPGEGLVKVDPEITNGVTKYAAPEVKATLERYLNPTLRDGNIKTAYEAYMKLKNADNGISLLLGAYHLRFMFQEAPINEIGQGFARILKNPGEAIKDIIKAPLAPYTLFKSGKNDVLDAVLHPDKIKDPFDKVINATLKEAGALPPVRVRGMGVTPELETGAVKGLATAWKPAFDEYVRDQVQAALKIGNKAKVGDYLGVGKDTSMATLKALTEGMQLVMHPMFNTYIPLLKAGANFQNMKRFYIDNPGLSHDQYVAAGRNFVRSTDNAMGELNQSTLYAPGYVKAIGNGAMVSLGWNIGSVKQFLGGARAFIRNPSAAFTGPNYDPRIMYVPAFIAVTALSNIATQLFHGQGLPKDLTDVAFPRSGGKTKAGNPERIIQPGYEKDVAEAANIVGGPEHLGQSFTKMMYNKLAPFPKTLIDEFVYNKNFAGKDIVNENDPFAKRLQDYWSYFEKHALTPIIAQSATSDNNPRSKIGPVEHMLGNRHAPQQWEDPQQYADRIRNQNQKGAKAADKFHKQSGY